MNTKIIVQPYSEFIKDVVAFCETACIKYHIPVMLITTRKPGSEIVRTLFGMVVPMDPATSSSSLLTAFKKDKDWKRIKKQMDELQNSSLYLHDDETYTEESMSNLDLRGIRIVFIDDGAAVPPVDFLEKWASEKDITIVVRKD